MQEASTLCAHRLHQEIGKVKRSVTTIPYTWQVDSAVNTGLGEFRVGCRKEVRKFLEGKSQGWQHLGKTAHAQRKRDGPHQPQSQKYFRGSTTSSAEQPACPVPRRGLFPQSREGNCSDMTALWHACHSSLFITSLPGTSTIGGTSGSPNISEWTV